MKMSSCQPSAFGCRPKANEWLSMKADSSSPQTVQKLSQRNSNLTILTYDLGACFINLVKK